jgi:nitrogen fixation NifU-like protein
MVALAIKASVDTYEERREDPEYPVITYKVTNSCVPKDENMQKEEN